MFNKIIPIKVERHHTWNYRVVEWKLGNTCNYDCSFCGSINKDGSQRWLPLEVYKRVCNELVQSSNLVNKKVIFQLTGGEPTLYPELIELLQYIKNIGGHVNIISNGSRTVRWWKEFATQNLIDTLFLTMHTEQGADPAHILEVTELFKDLPVTVLVQCTALPEWFDAVVNNYNRIKNEGCCLISLKLINGNSGKNYTPAQQSLIADSVVVPSKRWAEKTKSNLSLNALMRITNSNGTNVVNYAHAFIANGFTNFYGWTCNIGIDYINIVYDKIYRGQCRVGGVVGSIYDPVDFQKDSIICDKVLCDCATDYHETKIYKYQYEQ